MMLCTGVPNLLAGGLVSVFVDGLKGSLKPVVLDKRGYVSKVEAVCYATPPSGWLDDEDVNRTEVDFEHWLLEELADREAPRPKVLVKCEPQQMPEGQKARSQDYISNSMYSYMVYNTTNYKTHKILINGDRG